MYKSEINQESSKSIIEDVESLLTAKKKYFEHENDLFSIEFRWFQFYNSLSDNHRLLINCLKEKNNWKKVLLIFYLNSLLVNSASTDLPTNDNEHKELGESLSQIGKEQLKYIKEYYLSKLMLQEVLTLIIQVFQLKTYITREAVINTNDFH